MVSLKNVKGSRVSRARSATVLRSRVAVSRRPTSAPGRISLNKESILRMTKTQAREALRTTTPMTFYRKGRMGLTLFALLLIIATRPVGALGPNFAVAAGYRPGNSPPNTRKNKHWWQAFHARETPAAAQIAKQSAILTTAYTTGSGTATTAVVLSQLTSTVYGKYIVAMTIIAFIISRILSYGEASMQRKTQKEQMDLIEKQMAHQSKMLEMMIQAQATSPRARRSVARRSLPANRIAAPALMAP